MRKTDSVVVALRAYLSGDVDEFNRLSKSFTPDERDASGALITAAFFNAAEKRFSEETVKSEVIDFVSAARARSDRLAEAIDPSIAERLLLAVFVDNEIGDIDDKTRGDHYALLLVGLIVEAQLSDAELDEFLAEASELAETLLQKG